MIQPTQHTKVYQTITAISAKEYIRIRKGIARTKFYYDELGRLFDSYINQFKESEKSVPVATQDKIWPLILPDEKFNPTKMRRMNSDLLKCIKSHLEIDYIEHENTESSLLILKILNEYRMDKLVEEALDHCNKIVELTPYKNSEYYYDKFRVLKEVNTYNERNKSRIGIPNFKEFLINLDLFYLSEKLRNYCELLSIKNVLMYEYQPLFMEEILMHIEQVDYSPYPVVYSYCLIYKMLSDPDNEDHYFKYRDYFSKQVDYYEPLEAQNLFRFGQNYCVKKINSGRMEYLREFFNWYNLQIETNRLIYNDELSPWTFKNIVTTALRLKEFDWASNFIHKHKPYIPYAHRENAYRYNLANLCFYRADYNQVLKLLSAVEYEDIFYQLDAKSLLMKTYFERKDFSALIHLMQSFGILLRRNKMVSEFYRKIYSNQIKFIKQLVKSKYMNKNQLLKLLEQLEKETHIADSGWIREKINTELHKYKI